MWPLRYTVLTQGSRDPVLSFLTSQVVWFQASAICDLQTFHPYINATEHNLRTPELLWGNRIVSQFCSIFPEKSLGKNVVFWGVWKTKLSFPFYGKLRNWSLFYVLRPKRKMKRETYEHNALSFLPNECQIVNLMTFLWWFFVSWKVSLIRFAAKLFGGYSTTCVGKSFILCSVLYTRRPN